MERAAEALALRASLALAAAPLKAEPVSSGAERCLIGQPIGAFTAEQPHLQTATHSAEEGDRIWLPRHCKVEFEATMYQRNMGSEVHMTPL